MKVDLQLHLWFPEIRIWLIHWELLCQEDANSVMLCER
jgi:hypothetical protein